MHRSLVFFASFLGLCAAGCFKSHGGDDDTSPDGDADADSDTDTDADGDCQGTALPRSVDLLVLVDNSGSMAQEQANLTASFELLTASLLGGTDLDGDGIVEPPAVDSLHVGVISPDMGTGGFAVQTCRDAIDGDDGILLHTRSGVVAGCADAYPPFLDAAPGEGAAEDVAADFACIGTVGTSGCGFEQPLKAVRKALTVHAEGANAGFLRDDSLLALLLVTDEEDCSVREDMPNATDIFNTQLALGPLNLRCYNHRDQYVEPVDTFVQDILALRPCRPGHLAAAAIVGIPPENRQPCNLTDMSDAEYQCLLDLPDMQEVIDNSAEGKGERLTPSCDEAGLGEAFPPRRIVQFLRDLGHAGATTSVHSICDASGGSAMERYGAELRGALGGQ